MSLIGALAKIGLVEGAATPAPAPRVIPATAPSFSPPAPQPILTPEDQDRLRALSAQVYATPSSYVIFQRVRESLGANADLGSVLRVLTAANPGVTTEKVLADIEAHLGIVASRRAEFDSQVAGARAARVDGPGKEIAALTRENEEAQAKIAERTARIAELTRSTLEAEHSIADGAARFQLVEDQLRAPLLGTKQLLSSLR